MTRCINIPMEELRRLYEVEGLSTAEIAQYYKCSPTTIATRLRQQQLSRHAAPLPITTNDVRQYYLDEQLSVHYITQRLGRPVPKQPLNGAKPQNLRSERGYRSRHRPLAPQRRGSTRCSLRLLGLVLWRLRQLWEQE